MRQSSRCATAISSAFVSGLLVSRKPDSQKYDFGHVLVVAGSRGMTGAAILCAHGALRAGAGLVTLAVPVGEIDHVVCRLRPEVMTLALPGRDGVLGALAVKMLRQYSAARRVSSLVLGPGLGSAAGLKKFIEQLITVVDIPMVIDADALTAVARSPIAQRSLLTMSRQVVMTPHEGELARLLSCSAADVRKNRVAAAVECARRYRVVCVLKGHETVITDGEKVYANVSGNPGMATGGSGDVLAGMVGALYAQVHEPKILNAALFAVLLHGSAGDSAAQEKTQIAMIAGDIIDAIPYAFKKLLKR